MDAAPQSAESFSAHVERVAAALETRAAQAGESAPVSREAVRDVLRSIAEQAPESAPVPQPVPAASVPVPAAVPATGPTTRTIDVLPDYLRAEDADPAVVAKVESLVTEAFRHGLVRALKSARSQPPIVEDAFHDALVDIVLPLLKERNML